MADPKSILDGVQAPNPVKADAWDAFNAAGSPGDFKARFDKIELPKEAKAALWDAKFSGVTAGTTQNVIDDPTNVRVGTSNGIPVYRAGSNVVRPGASDDEIIQSFGFDPAVIKGSPRYQDAMKQHGSGVSFNLTDPNRNDLIAQIANSKAGDMGQGALDVLKGVVQLARHGAGKVGLLSDADVQYGDLLDRIQNQDYLENIRHGQASPALRLVGNLLVPVPGGPEARAGEGFLATTGKAALRGAEAGAVQPVDADPKAGFWTEKGKQALTGGAVGAGTAALVGGITRGGAALKSRIQNSKAVQLPEEVAADAEKANAAATATAEAGNFAAQQQGNAMVSRAETRAANARTTAQGAAETSVGQLRAGVAGAGRDIEDVTAAAQGGDRHAAQVLDQVSNAGDDPARVMESGINLQNWRTGRLADQKYTEVENLATRYHLGPMPLSGTNLVLNRAETEAGVGMRDRGLQRTLEDVRAAITPQEAAGYGSVQNQTAPEAHYSTARKVISQLDQIIRSGRTGDNALVSDRGLGQLQQVKNALENDVNDFVQGSKVPELQKAQKAADEYYRQVRVPFRDVNIAKAGTTDEADTIFKKFVMAGRGDRAQKFYDALDSKGRAAVQYEIVADAFNKATDSATGDFKPQAFFNTLDKVKEAYGVFFQGPERLSIDGVKKLMQHAMEADAAVPNVRTLADQGLDRASEVGKFNVAATKERGTQAVAASTAQVRKLDKYPLGTTAAAALGAAEASRLAGMPGITIAAGTVGAIAGTLKALMMTDAGKRFLLAANLAPPQSQAMARLINRISEFAAKGATKQ